MSISFNSSVAANLDVLRSSNEQFQIAQRRVATGKKIFGASDDAARFRMSETMLGRARQLNDVNNNISLGLKSLEAVDNAIKNINSLMTQASELARKAQSEGAESLRSTATTANLGATSVVAGYTAGPTARISITSDSGQNFTYFMNRTGITWGEISDALNAANIGVQAEIVSSTTAGQTNLRFKSTNGKDFKFDAISDQSVMDDLVGLRSATGGTAQLSAANAAAYFGATGTVVAGETGFTVSYGGAALGTKVGPAAFTPSSASLVFKDGNGQVRSYQPATSSTNVTAMILEFNGRFQSTGVVAELANVTGTAGQQQLRFRNTNGGNMDIIAGTGDFANNAANIGLAVPSTGYAAPLSSNTAMRLELGRQYDAILGNIASIVANVPVQSGRNLINGQNMGIVMDELGTANSSLTITGLTISTGSLGLAQAGSTWTTDANIQTSATQAGNALNTLRGHQSTFATYNSYVKGRYDINKTTESDLNSLGNELVAADVAEESANLTALQTQQQFAVHAFSMGSSNQQALLRLLG